MLADSDGHVDSAFQFRCSTVRVFTGVPTIETSGLTVLRSSFVQQADMELLLDNAMFERGIGQLELTPKENPIVWIESPLVARDDREASTRMLFESLDVPAVFNASAAVMALYANAMTTGLVVSLGDCTGHVTPVYEGYAKRSMTARVAINSAVLAQYMLMLTRGPAAVASPTDPTMRDMVSQLCRGEFA